MKSIADQIKYQRGPLVKVDRESLVALIEENRELRKTIELLTERCAAQSKLLARRAEK